MRWLLVVAGMVVGAAVAVIGIGAALPVAHVAAVRVQLLFRFVSRFILGHYATLERYGGDLASHFGSEGGVQRVAPDR